MNTMKEKEYIISTTGFSRIFVKPNYFTIDISLECVSGSMNTSLNMINDDMTNLYRIGDLVGINNEVFNVIDLDFSLDYEWKNSSYIFKGYKVNQKVAIECDVTIENEEKAKQLVGQVSNLLRNMKKCDISYALRNKKEHLTKVRELSFLDAKEKAEHYATLAGVKIVGTNTITDIEPIEEYSRNNLYDSGSQIGSSGDTNLPNGKKIVLENTVYVVFDIEKK